MIHAENLTVAIDREVLLAPVSLQIAPGQAVALTGANGSGKTTLLRVFAGLQRPTSGMARLAGAPISERDPKFRARVAALIGIPPLARDLTLREHLEMVAATWGQSAKQAQQRANQLLTEFDIAHLAHRFPHEISSGQTQLFALALTLARDFEVLLLDEPEQRLDSERLEVVIAVLNARKTAGATLLIATHGAEIVDSLADFAVQLP